MASLRFRQEKNIRQRYNDTEKYWTFQVRIIDSVGISHTKSFRSIDFSSDREAFLSAISYRNSILEEKNADFTEKIVYKDFCEVFEEFVCNSSISFETARKKRICVNKWFSLKFKEKYIHIIKAIDVENELKNMVKNGATNGIIQDAHTICKQTFEYAIKSEYISKDVMRGIIVPKSHKAVKKKDVVLREGTLEEIIGIIRKKTRNMPSSIHDNELIIFSLLFQYYLGIRPAECYALTPSDLDIENRTVHITKSVGSEARNVPQIRDTKTELSYRDVPMSDGCYEIATEILDKYGDREYIFTRYNGKLFDSNYVSSKLKHWCEDSQINFNQYMLRHNLATTLILAGTDVRTVKELMGHNNIDMSVSYARSNENAKNKAINSIKNI